MTIILDAFSVIKNGIDLGYVFVEGFSLVLPHVRRMWVQDGHSEDDTFKWLQMLDAKHHKFTLSKYKWPRMPTGFAIGAATNRCMDWARSGEATHFLYVQADEIWHPDSLDYMTGMLEKYPDVDGWNFQFLHLQNNMQEVQPGAGYTRAVRLVRNVPWISSHRDAWTFEGCREIKTVDLPVPIIHNNRSFWHNIPRKLKNHAKELYADLGHYAASSDEASVLYAVGEENGVPEMFTRTDSPFMDILPDVIKPLLGQLAYKPQEELVR